MKTRATKTAILSLELDFSTKASTKRALKTYAAEIEAGMQREGMNMEDIAWAANVCTLTVSLHKRMKVKNPQVRTMFSILFALGWEQIVIAKEGFIHDVRKAA